MEHSAKSDSFSDALLCFLVGLGMSLEDDVRLAQCFDDAVLNFGLLPSVGINALELWWGHFVVNHCLMSLVALKQDTSLVD